MFKSVLQIVRRSRRRPIRHSSSGRKLGSESLERRIVLASTSPIPFSGELSPATADQFPLTKNPLAMVVADMDGASDGNTIADIITASFDDDTPLSGQVVLYEGNASGDFAVGNGGSPLASGLNGAHTIDAADLTGNGLLDIVVGTNIDVVVIRQTALGVFAAPEQLLDFSSDALDDPFTAAVVKTHDVDGNNLEDLIVAWERKVGQQYEEAVVVYRNFSAGQDVTLIPSTTIATNASVEQLGVVNDRGEIQRLRTLDIEVGPINGDAHPDIVIALGTADAVLWFENNTGNLGTFSDGKILSNSPDDLTDNVRAVALANIDGSDDGSLDVIIAGHNSQAVAWFANDGTGEFATAVKLEEAGALVGPTDVFTSDVNGDGAIDVLVASRIAGITLFLNAGEATFGSAQAVSTPGRGAELTHASIGVAAVDLEADGDVDILAAGDKADLVTLYRNAINHAKVADFNANNRVDDPDLVIWMEHLGLDSGALLTDGDADGDGDVDGNDFLIWQQNYEPPIQAPPPAELNSAPADESGSGSAVLVGDADGDDDVDAEDFHAWESGFNSDAPPSLSSGDFDGDNDIDGDDFLLWQANFGESIPDPLEATADGENAETLRVPDAETSSNARGEAIQVDRVRIAQRPFAEIPSTTVEARDSSRDLLDGQHSENRADSLEAVAVPADDVAVPAAAVPAAAVTAKSDLILDEDDFFTWQANFAVESDNVTGGDFDQDSDVDGEDFLFWQVHFVPAGGNAASLAGNPIGSGDLIGDMDGDGDADEYDFGLWIQFASNRDSDAGDFDGDGDTDGDDFLIWQASYVSVWDQDMQSGQAGHATDSDPVINRLRSRNSLVDAWHASIATRTNPTRLASPVAPQPTISIGPLTAQAHFDRESARERVYDTAITTFHRPERLTRALHLDLASDVSLRRFVD